MSRNLCLIKSCISEVSIQQGENYCDVHYNFKEKAVCSDMLMNFIMRNICSQTILL